MNGTYGELVATLFRAAPHAGRPDGACWAEGEAREPLSGTHVRWYLRVVDGRIADARYQIRGCPHTMAAAAVLAAELPGRPAAATAVDPRSLAARVGAPTGKLGRLLVIEDALHSALRAAALILDGGVT